MAKASVTDINEVPEALRGEYEQRDGKYFLKVEGDELPGFVPALKHAQFRDNNKRIMAALGADTVDAAIARVSLFSGIDPAKLERMKAIDPDEYEALKTKIAGLEKKGVTKPDDVQTAIEAALEGFKKTVVMPLQEELKGTKKTLQDKDARIADATLRDAVGQKFTKAGGRSEAGVLDFILSRARQSFRVVDDKVVAAEGKYGTNGEPLTVDEWITGATKEHAFAFQPSGGGGANPSSGGRNPTPPNGTFRTPGGTELKTDGISVLS